MKILILAVGKMRGSEAAASEEYKKRLKGEVTIKEIAVSKSLSSAEMIRAEAELLLKAIPEGSFVILLDERGKDLTSRELSTKIVSWQDVGKDLVFIIGGADGVSEKVREKTQFTLSFGKLTWPHRLVRVMLLEQIYRAQQIKARHPYHRD